MFTLDGAQQKLEAPSPTVSRGEGATGQQGLN